MSEEEVITREELGFRPDLDRLLIYNKVMGIMQDLHEGKFIYFSNGTEGEMICYHVVERCNAERRYDQYFIIKEIFELRWEGHSDFWKQKAEEKE